MDQDLTVTVSDVPERHRFEVRVDGRPAGFAAYRRAPGRLVVTHTEVADRYEGQGVASTLVREALDEVRRRGWSVEPRCPFFRAWIDRHPDYADLVATSPPSPAAD